MQIKRLDHVNILTCNPERMVAWYEAALGLKSGPRPDFPFGGAWLYAGDAAVVHLISVDGPPPVGSEVGLKLEHFAFSATGAAKFELVLEQTGTAYDKISLPAAGLVQYHVADPDGNHVHIDFEAAEQDVSH